MCPPHEGRGGAISSFQEKMQQSVEEISQQPPPSCSRPHASTGLNPARFARPPHCRPFQLSCSGGGSLFESAAFLVQGCIRDPSTAPVGNPAVRDEALLAAGRQGRAAQNRSAPRRQVRGALGNHLFFWSGSWLSTPVVVPGLPTLQPSAGSPSC